MADADLLRPQLGHRVQRPVPPEPRQGPDRSVRRLRPPHPDRLRPRPPAGQGRGRQGRRARRPPRPHAPAAGRHPRGRDEHVDDHQRHGRLAARPLRGPRRGGGRRALGPAGDDPERHRQGVPVPRDLHLPAAAQPPVDRGHGGLLRQPHPGVEPDQRLLVPPAGGRGDPGPGDRLRHGHRRRRARRSAGVRPGRRGPVPGRRGLHLLLRERRHPLRRGDLQAPGDDRAVGPAHAGALRRAGRQGPSIPLRRPGQLAGPDRGPAREQRPAHRAGGARA